MKAKESYIGTKKECITILNKVLPELFTGNLILEGQNVVIPSDEELEYKFKFEELEEYNYGVFGLKIKWGEKPEVDEEYEEEYEE